MRFVFMTIVFLVFTLTTQAQNPVLAVNRVDKFTKELIKQTSLYPFKDGSSTRLYFNVRSVDENYYLQFNVPQAVTIKKGTGISLTMGDGKVLNLVSDNDIISLSDSDISKRMFVCTLDEAEINALLKQEVNSIRVPTANKGVLALSLAPKDKTMIRTAMALVSPKPVAKKL